jgi:methionyl aminopeptidase
MIKIKNDFQIRQIKKSCILVAESLDFIYPFVKPGVTTNELNNKIRDFMIKNNARSATLGYCGYPKETCISINEVVCHGIPSDRILTEGDIINIDVSLELNGFFGDASRMYAVGEISKEAKELIEITEKSLYEGISAVSPGNTFNMIGYNIYKLLKDTKYSIVDKFVGHGCGIDFHEDPKISHIVDENLKDFGQKMMPGMIFTIEPMINLGSSDCVILEDKWTAITIDKKLSAQYEHMVLCTENGYEILSKIN